MLGFDEPDPGRYALEYAVCKEMAWSWPDLMEAPFDFVEEIGLRLAARAKWQGEKDRLDKAKAQSKPR